MLDNMRHIIGTWRRARGPWTVGPGPGPLALGYRTDPEGRAAGAIAEDYYLLHIDLNIYCQACPYCPIMGLSPQ